MPDEKIGMDQPSEAPKKTPKAPKNSPNVLQRLVNARVDFLNEKVEKTGKNQHLKFKYFELDDIVPPATRICQKHGLLVMMQIGGEEAVAHVINTDDPNDCLRFAIPFREVAPIVNSDGVEVTNPIQRLGSSVTYLRRYLWMLVMDISEPDDVDPSLDESTQPPKAPAADSKPKSAPPTAQERKEIKQVLTAPPPNSASEEQINALKGICKKLIAIDPERESDVQKIALQTQGFTNVTAEKCGKLIELLTKTFEAYPQEAKDALA